MSVYYYEPSETPGPSDFGSPGGPREFSSPSASGSRSDHSTPPRSPPAEAEVRVNNACHTCQRDIALPCAIYLMRPCHNCTRHIRRCYVCDGSGDYPVPLPDGTYEDCTACIGTGNMVTCRLCRGRGRVSCGACDAHDPRCEVCGGTGRTECSACEGRGRRRCQLCQASGVVGDFDRFCQGDIVIAVNPRPPTQRARRHPNTRRIPRVFWSRVEEVREAEDVVPVDPPR